MSLQYSDTSNYLGLAQMYEKEIGANYGDVTGNTAKMKEFTARARMALDNYLLLWAKNAGNTEADDMNHTDFQIITTSLVANQRDYVYTTDGDGNRITDVAKVLVLESSTATSYREIRPIDETNTDISDILVNTNTGVPYQYGKMGNAILLDYIPSYSVAAGLKMVVMREGSYPVYTDTIKVIGVPAYHEYFYLRPAMEYARINNLANFPRLQEAVIDLEGDEARRITGKIATYFGVKGKDERRIMKPKLTNFI